MTMTRLIRAELRKLTSTRMPWAFLLVLLTIAAINAFAVIAGTDFDGSKGFISTEADQQSLVAFAANGFSWPHCLARSPWPVNMDITRLFPPSWRPPNDIAPCWLS